LKSNHKERAVFCGLPEIHSQFTLWEMVFEGEGENGDAVSGERE
jgi:hypothetical protein